MCFELYDLALIVTESSPGLAVTSTVEPLNNGIGSKRHKTSMTVMQFCLIQLSCTKVAIAYCLSGIFSESHHTNENLVVEGTARKVPVSKSSQAWKLYDFKECTSWEMYKHAQGLKPCAH